MARDRLANLRQVRYILKPASPCNRESQSCLLLRRRRVSKASTADSFSLPSSSRRVKATAVVPLLAMEDTQMTTQANRKRPQPGLRRTLVPLLEVGPILSNWGLPLFLVLLCRPSAPQPATYTQPNDSYGQQAAYGGGSSRYGGASSGAAPQQSYTAVDMSQANAMQPDGSAGAQQDDESAFFADVSLLSLAWRKQT